MVLATFFSQLALAVGRFLVAPCVPLGRAQVSSEEPKRAQESPGELRRAQESTGEPRRAQESLGSPGRTAQESKREPCKAAVGLLQSCC